MRGPSGPLPPKAGQEQGAGRYFPTASAQGPRRAASIFSFITPALASVSSPTTSARSLSASYRGHSGNPLAVRIAGLREVRPVTRQQAGDLVVPVLPVDADQVRVAEDVREIAGVVGAEPARAALLAQIGPVRQVEPEHRRRMAHEVEIRVAARRRGVPDPGPAAPREDRVGPDQGREPLPAPPPPRPRKRRAALPPPRRGPPPSAARVLPVRAAARARTGRSTRCP